MLCSWLGWIMMRRQFIAIWAGFSCLLASVVMLFRSDRKAETCNEPAMTPPPAEESELIQRVRRRIAQHLPTHTTFDPVTLLAMVGFVLRIIQVCQTGAILRQQAQCEWNPTGFTAMRIRRKLHAQFAADHPEVSESVIQIHVDAAMKAFVEARTRELLDLKSELERTNRQPTEIDLFNLSEDLSRV